MSFPISEHVAERLLALMRPEDDVHWSSAAQGLLAVIGEALDPGAALAFVFAEKPWVHWSGPKTLAFVFPTPLDDREGSPEVTEYHERDDRLQRRYTAFMAKIRRR